MTAEPTTQKQEEGRIVVTFVITGQTVMPDNKSAAWRVQLLREDGSRGEPVLYRQKNLKTAFVGGVFEIEASDPEGNTIYPSTCRWVRSWENQTERLQWSAEARAEQAARDAERRRKHEKERNLIREHLAPLHAVWLRTNPQGRRALEVLVLEALRSGTVREP